MNYLSHYFIDSKPDEHYYNAALILPDITKPWIKTFRTPEPDTPPSFSQNQLALLQGALKHYHSDKLFHASAFFDHYQNLTESIFKGSSFLGNAKPKMVYCACAYRTFNRQANCVNPTKGG
jgi:hypothetical protein